MRIRAYTGPMERPTSAEEENLAFDLHALVEAKLTPEMDASFSEFIAVGERGMAISDMFWVAEQNGIAIPGALLDKAESWLEQEVFVYPPSTFDTVRTQIARLRLSHSPVS